MQETKDRLSTLPYLILHFSLLFRMPTLSSLTQGVNVISIRGDKDVQINSLVADSRDISGCNSAFIAISGHAEDGHKFIQSAIDAGACAVICERMLTQLSPEVTYIQVFKVFFN